MRCIECEEIELARVRDERPTQTLAVPHAALDGFPAGRSPGALTRRRLLQGGVAGLASVYGAEGAGWESIWESVAAEGAPLDQNCLVMLYLTGGNDGLNTIVPNGPPTTPPTTRARRRSTAGRARAPAAGWARRRWPARRRSCSLRERDGLGRRRNNGDSTGSTRCTPTTRWP